MNKVSDKLVPKELAPFLPIASAFLPGLGGGIMSQYLLPQLLTAASSAKMTGEVDPKAQAITGIMSALQGQTNAEKQFIKDNPGAFDSANEGALRDARFKELGGEYSSGDRSDFYRDVMNKTSGDIVGEGGNFGNQFMDKVRGLDDSLSGVNSEYGYNLVGGQGFADTAKGNKALNAYLDSIQGPLPKGFEYLKAKDVGNLTGDKFKDFFTAGDMDEKAFDKLFTKSAGEVGKFGTAIDKARNFMNTDIGFNKATALKAGLGATPYLMNEAEIAARKIEEENAAAEAANQSYRDASSALTNYFVNRDPNYGMLYGYNQGGRVNLSEGSGPDMDRVLELEEQGFSYEEAFEKAMQERFDRGYNQGGRVGLDEGGFLSNILGDSTVDDIQRGLLGIMGATDSMMGMGMSEYDDAFQEMIDAGISEEDIIDMLGPRPDFTMQANGGRVNKNMGGIMNVGSIPQTPMVPQGMQLNGRGGGFIPMGAQEKKDDVPAMLAKNEFVMTSDAVRAAGGGSIEKGAQKMYDLMNSLEAQV